VREKTLTIEQALSMLAEAPRRIAALTARVEPARLGAPPNEGEWSANDVLAHLRACADVWGGSIVTMVREDHPTIRAISPRTWIHDTDYPDRAFGPSLQAYTSQRSELLALLKTLPPKDWARGGTFTGAGRLLERTVLSEASAIAVHERPHVKQIERVVNIMRVEDS
jgi:DinB family protein